jgi:hypothetical protein
LKEGCNGLWWGVADWAAGQWAGKAAQIRPDEQHVRFMLHSAPHPPHHEVTKRYCYITVDSAMVASQNRFCPYKLSIHKKTNIMKIMAKYYIFLI